MTTKEEARRMSDEGVRFLERDDLDKGIFLIKQALKDSPEDVCILDNMAEACLKKKDYWSAVQIFWIVEKNLVRNKENITKHPGAQLKVQKKLDSAIKLMEEEGVALLWVSRPARVGNVLKRVGDCPASKAVIIFQRALEFAPDKLSLRRQLITALEVDGQILRAFICAKQLALEIVDPEKLDHSDWEQLSEALRLYLPDRIGPVVGTAKSLLPDFLAAEKPNEIGLKRLKKVLQIFLPQVDT